MTLEINIHPHHYTKKQDTIDSGYQSCTSSFTASPTTSTSSQRSSFSSQHSSLQSANEKIEFLEDQIKTRKLSNHSIVKDMSFQIETFLMSRSNCDPSRNTIDTLGPVIDKLNEIKDIVTTHHITLSQDTAPINLKNELFFSTQIIENWIYSATQHRTKQDLQNVEQKHQRLAQAIQTLSQQHTSTKQELRKLQKIHASVARSHANTLQEKKILHQDKQEIEQLLDEVRDEMENMMEELNQVKSDSERFEEKANRYELDLQSVDTEDDDFQVVALRGLLREAETQVEQLQSDQQEQRLKHASETKALQAKITQAQSSAAQVARIAASKKREQQSVEMEQALRRTVAERDGELAKVRFELEKSQRHTDQMKAQRDKQMQLELNTRLEDLETDLQSQYKKISDGYQVQISRELRTLSGQIVELETELEGLERQHKHDLKRFTDAEDKLKRVQSSWETNQTSSKQTIHQLQGKVQVLEGEVLLLYSKNLELTQHLGELDE